MKRISREVTPISVEDFFLLQNHYHAQFDYTIHFHPEYEINLVFSTFGKRFIGNFVENFENIDIALIGSNVLHAWTSESNHNNARVITIQFSRDFLGRQFLKYNEMKRIRHLLDDSRQGVVFTGKSLITLKNSIIALAKTKEFDKVISFLLLLDQMTRSEYKIVHAAPVSKSEPFVHHNSRILAACDYIKRNYYKKICINDLAELMSMTPSAFSHFFKKRTYKSFTEYLIDIRISHACQMLLETDLSVAYIAEKNGFSNLSNFNKLFKTKKKTTPNEFRKVYYKRQIGDI